MAHLVKRKPTSPGRRFVIDVQNKDLYTGDSLRALTEGKKRINGRNNQGRVTVRHRRGGHKRNYRLIDFKRNKDNIPAVVERIEYDPNRSANIALLLYKDGERRYIIANKGLKVGDNLISGEEVPIEAGNATVLKNMPLGSVIHCIEMQPGKGAQLARSAGASVQLVAKDTNYATLRLCSGEVRKVPLTVRATYGEVGNVQHSLRKLGKAGAKRWRGIAPTVRGVAMNPIDHPHGGGEGRTSGGRHPVSPWGVQTKGHKTRHKKASDRLIIRRKKSRK